MTEKDSNLTPISAEESIAIKEQVIMFGVLRHATDRMELGIAEGIIKNPETWQNLFTHQGEVGKPGMVISIDLPYTKSTRHFRLVRSYSDPETGRYWNKDSGFKGMIFLDCDENGGTEPDTPAYVVYPGTDHDRIRTALINRIKGGANKVEAQTWGEMLRSIPAYLNPFWQRADISRQEAPIYEYVAIAMNLVGRSNRRGVQAMEFVKDNADLLEGREIISIGNSLGATAAIWGFVASDALGLKNAQLYLVEGFTPDTAIADAAYVAASHSSTSGNSALANMAEIIESVLERTTSVVLNPASLANTPPIGKTYAYITDELRRYSDATHALAAKDKGFPTFSYSENLHVFCGMALLSARQDIEIMRQPSLSMEDIFNARPNPSKDLQRSVLLIADWVVPTLATIMGKSANIVDLDEVAVELSAYVRSYAEAKRAAAAEDRAAFAEVTAQEPKKGGRTL